MSGSARVGVFAPGGVRSALQAAAVDFERDSGERIAFTFCTGGGIERQVAAGAPADVAVLPAAAIDALQAQGRVVAGSRLALGTVGVGVGVRAGSPRPRIATVAEFRESLLAASSLTYADPAQGGTSGTYFATVVLPRLGIAETVRAKTVLAAVGEEAVRRVADGKSALVIVQSSEITAVTGAELVGPLPREIQADIPYAAVAVAGGPLPVAAAAFLRHLASPAGRRAFRAAGFETP